MIKTNRWTPDTCACEIDFTWDDELPEARRVHTGSAVAEACPAHEASRDDPRAHYGLVLEENQRKNDVLRHIFEAIPSAIETIIQPDGSAAPRLARGKEYLWEFDADRNLVVTLPGFTVAERAAVLAYAKTRDKVVVR